MRDQPPVAPARPGAQGRSVSLSGQITRLQRMRIRAASSADASRPSPEPTGPAKLLRPPRQSSTQDAEDWLLIDRDTYMYMAQDFTHTKTMLHKLRRVLQDSETSNPFEHSLQPGRRGTSVSSEVSSLDGRGSVDGGADLAAENADLKKQVAALQQQLEEKDRTIHLLQQQMSKYATTALDVSTVATQASQVVTEDPHVITFRIGQRLRR
ncbi:uncharacterized protein LOC119089815 isoform X1 [Pollicipes pollicipes]|uniref:uncharacterized protein LOC119089815 isoform X1 n=1 Tax=Pollicipes pollicipes TaxID=41117 RepID=UPI001884FDFF|nr:uncharacterized protein LOC119089815 isoform X1 [Pollicipes pollicipes]